MKENSVELTLEFEESGNITDLLERRCREDGDLVLYRIQDSPGQWREVTAAQFRSEVTALAKGLIASGIRPGDRVAIMSRTRYEWALLDLAIFYAGGVVVPVYETSSPSQIAWNLSNSGAKAMFAEQRQHVQAVKRASRHEKLSLEHLWQIEGATDPSATLDSLREAGADITDEQLEQARSHASLKDLATIIYTSGTTGKPKGCALSHSNFVKLSGSARQAIPEVARPGSSTLMFLPLAHVFARYIHILAIDAGVTVGHSPDLKNLVEDIQSFRPEFLLVVPRVFEKIYNGARSKAHDASAIKGRLFDAAERAGVEWSKTVMDGRKPSPLLALRYKVLDALVLSKIRQAMGGQAQYAVSGGGPLSPRLGHFFHAVGIKILEGYGLTETTAPVTVGTVQDFQIGTVGPPLPGMSVKIAEDGEILCRGVGVIEHYYENPKADEEGFTEDGWYRTGDLGELTERGFLKITGRKKEVIVTAGGKNVIPAQYEDLIRASALVSQCVVIGDNRPFIAALVTLDEETLPKQLERLGLDPKLSPEEAAQQEPVRQEVQKLIDKANAETSKAESVRAFRIIGSDFTEESGHLTPSLKIRRPKILKDYEDVIEEIYNAPKPTQG